MERELRSRRKKENLSIKMIFHWYSSYLTNWSLTYFFLYIFRRIDQAHHKSHILFLTHVSMIGGLYITYISPRFVCIPYLGGVCIYGTLLKLADLVTHTLPCMYMHKEVWDTPSQDPYDIKRGLLLCLLFLCMWDPFDKYLISYYESIVIGLVSLVMTWIWISLSIRKRIFFFYWESLNNGQEQKRESL